MWRTIVFKRFYLRQLSFAKYNFSCISAEPKRALQKLNYNTEDSKFSQLLLKEYFSTNCFNTIPVLNKYQFKVNI